MKKLKKILCTILLVIICARCIAQNITFSANNVPLGVVLGEIRKQTGIVSFCTENLIQSAKLVSINAENIPVAQFLDDIFRGQPLQYNLKGKNLFISPKLLSPRTPIPQDTGEAPLIAVKLHVLDTDEHPLPGASVYIKSQHLSGITNAEGDYSIALRRKDIAVVSFVGYQTREVTLNIELMRTGGVRVVLSRIESKLDEIQIIGYGTTTKRLATGTSTTVTSDIISKQPVTNPIEALSGRVPGLFIAMSNGMPGAVPTIQLRGQNSIDAGNQPLYIVDGIPFTSSPIDQVGASYFATPNGGNSPFNTLSPSDIESITVLKDADATAIYGSRGSNGVILINTKKGKRGKTDLSINVSTGRSRVTRLLPMLNTAQYLAMRKAAFINDGAAPDVSSAPDLTVWDSTKYTDWQKYLIGNDAGVVDIRSNLSGGNSQTSFLFSANYHRETTVFPGDFSYNRASFHLNVDHASADGKFGFSTSVLYTRDDNRLIGFDPTNSYNLPPNFPLYDASGNLNWQGNVNNPLGSLLTPYEAKSNNNIYGQFAPGREITGYGDAGGASRFFYVAKADAAERGAGNDHPTVKPLALMHYLIRLICRIEPGRVILDPFAGSGSTCIAVRQLGLDFYAFERVGDYVRIAERRLRDALGLFYDSGR